MDKERVKEAMDILFDEICVGIDDCHKCRMWGECGCILKRVNEAVSPIVNGGGING